jgi:hypothetical protein
MRVTREATYLSYEVHRALRLLAKSKDNGEGRPIITVDELADELLAEVLVERYPKITEHLRQVDKAEREVIKALGKAT